MSSTRPAEPSIIARGAVHSATGQVLVADLVRDADGVRQVDLQLFDQNDRRGALRLSIADVGLLVAQLDKLLDLCNPTGTKLPGNRVRPAVELVMSDAALAPKRAGTSS